MTWANTGLGAENTGLGAVDTLSVAYTGAITVGNLGVCAVSSANGTAVVAPTVTDQLGNTWSLVASLANSPTNTLGLYIFTTVFSAAGTPTVEADFGSNAAGLSMVITEYSFTSGTLAYGTVGTGNGNNSPFGITSPTTTLPISGVSKALVLAGVQWNQYNSGTFTAGTGFTIRETAPYNLYTTNTAATVLEDWMNVTTSSSPVTPAMTSNSGGGTPFLMTALVVTSSGDDTAGMTVSPTTDTNAQSVTYTVTGSGTSWTSGTTFGISGVTGAAITSQSITGQVGTVHVLLDNTHTGTLTFTDSTDSFTATSTVTLAAPGAPASPSCAPGNTQNVLNWSAPSTGGLPATYNVYRGTTPGGESGTPIVTGLTSTTYTNTGLTNGQIYYYTIKAVNATATGAASTEVNGTPTAGGGSLTSGTASVVSVGNTVASVNVATATGGTSPYTYQWYRSTTFNFTPGGGNIVAGATSATLNDTGLLNGTPYYYVNIVTDSASATANSNQISVTPTAGSSGGSGINLNTFGKNTFKNGEDSTVLIRTINAQFNNGASVIATGTKFYFVVPFYAKIVGWQIFSDVSTTATIDAWAVPLSAAPPTIANTIAGTDLIGLTAATANSDFVLSGWGNTVLQPNTAIVLNVASNNNAHVIAAQLILQTGS